MARGPDLFRSLFRRGLQANLVGAAIAFVYLTMVAPPKPEPPHTEWGLYLSVALYVTAAAVVSYVVSRRHFRPIERWLAQAGPPSEAIRDRARSC